MSGVPVQDQVAQIIAPFQSVPQEITQLIAPLMPRRVSPSGFVIRLDRWIAALRILNNCAAEAEEMWDEPSVRQRDGPPQQAGRHTEVDPTKVQLLHTVLIFLERKAA